MGELALRVEGLGKKYKRGVEMYGSLLERLRHSSQNDEFWALQNVSFEVARGEVLGIVGRNGSGKSTMLKLLARITRPTSGFAEVYGRVGSLLEVGTGFHPELTGRENIYLNGAILGMNKPEIDRKFDEIIEFAEIGKFIDTPVKRYSSGMYVRLAFAVAAHLEPEILLVDEVLAVGDANFQKKCLGKMSDVTHHGRTVLFVSHNMVAVQSLCSRVLWLHDSQMREQGPTASVVSNYLQASLEAINEKSWDNPATAPGNEKVRIRRLRVYPEGGTSLDPIGMDDACNVEIEFWNQVPDARLHMTLHVHTEQQIVAFSTGSCETDPDYFSHTFPTGLYRAVCRIPAHFLNSGIHRVLLLVVQNGDTVIYRMDEAVSFSVLDMQKRQVGWMGKEPGAIRPRLDWTTERLNA